MLPGIVESNYLRSFFQKQDFHTSILFKPTQFSDMKDYLPIQIPFLLEAIVFSREGKLQLEYCWKIITFFG